MAGPMRGSPIRAALVLALFVTDAGLSPRALAQGATDYPIPSSAREAFSPIREGFESPIEPREDLKGPKPHIDERERLLRAGSPGLRTVSPFFRDTELTANSRTYWFGEDQFSLAEPEALTTGCSIAYQSGLIADVFQLRSVLYTTQPLYAGEEAGDTLNLSPDGDEITMLGQINGRMKLAHQELTVGRQLVRTPYINPYDVRMIPLTFEGVVLLPEEDQPLDYIASYLSRYKPRNTDKFISFSEVLGVEQDEGVLVTGLRYRSKSWNYGFTNYWIKDTLNTAYGEVDYLLPIGGGDGESSFRGSVNDLDQRSVGADLIAGAPYETYQASARLAASYQNFVLTGAVSRVGGEADIQKPFGFSPAFTAMIITNFDRAGEQAYVLTLSYDFEKFGLEGVKFFVGWGRGTGAIDPTTGADLDDEDELDLRFVYEPRRGPLQGLRVAELPSEDLTQFRAIVNYAVRLL
jgi:hypothetical protein